MVSERFSEACVRPVRRDHGHVHVTSTINLLCAEGCDPALVRVADAPLALDPPELCARAPLSGLFALDNAPVPRHEASCLEGGAE